MDINIDEIDESLLPVFMEEADDFLPKLSLGLRTLHEHPQDEQGQLSLSRLLHTFKGSARMCGAIRIGELAHQIEDLVLLSFPRRVQAEYQDALERDFKQLCQLIEELRGNTMLTDVTDSSSRTLSAKVPFSSIAQRLHRVVQQTGNDLNKRANLKITGAEVELDRAMLDKMTAPFEHLLRNSMAHGLEPAELRKRKGKPDIGEIYLSLRQEGDELVFEFGDDGAGLDMLRLQQIALASGILRAGETLSTEQAIQMILIAGFSTAREITAISGRGVGLDVVRTEVSALGGHLTVAAPAGKGICFTIYLPVGAGETLMPLLG